MFNWLKSKQPTASRPESVAGFGYVGKTPQQADFVKYNLNTREAIGMDHWFREGIARSPRMGYGQQGQGLFFMAGNQDEANVIGVTLPSQDSHQRHYPFIGFVLCNNNYYQQHPAVLLLHQGDLLMSMHQLTGILKQASGPLAMERVAGGLQDIARSLGAPTDLVQEFDRFRQWPMSLLWEAVELHGADRSRFISGSCQLFRQLTERGSQRCHLGIRFPMSALTGGSMIIAAFWLHLMAMRLADRHWRPWFFYQWGDSRAVPSLTVFLRPPAASTLAALWQPGPDNHQVVDIAQLHVQGELAPSASQLAELEHMSMYDAMRRWCKC